MVANEWKNSNVLFFVKTFTFHESVCPAGEVVELRYTATKPIHVARDRSRGCPARATTRTSRALVVTLLAVGVACGASTRSLVRTERGRELERTPLSSGAGPRVAFSVAGEAVEATLERPCYQRVRFEERRDYSIVREPAASFGLWTLASLGPALGGGLCFVPVTDMETEVDGPLCSTAVTVGLFGAAGLVLLGGTLDQILAIDGTESDETTGTEMLETWCPLSGAIVRFGSTERTTGANGKVTFARSELTANDAEVHVPIVLAPSGDRLRTLEIPPNVNRALRDIEAERLRAVAEREAAKRREDARLDLEAAQRRRQVRLDELQAISSAACEHIGAARTAGDPGAGEVLYALRGAVARTAPAMSEPGVALAPGQRLAFECSGAAWSMFLEQGEPTNEHGVSIPRVAVARFVASTELELPERHALRLLALAIDARNKKDLEGARRALDDVGAIGDELSPSLLKRLEAERAALSRARTRLVLEDASRFRKQGDLERAINALEGMDGEEINATRAKWERERQAQRRQREETDARNPPSWVVELSRAAVARYLETVRDAERLQLHALAAPEQIQRFALGRVGAEVKDLCRNAGYRRVFTNLLEIAWSEVNARLEQVAACNDVMMQATSRGEGRAATRLYREAVTKFEDDFGKLYLWLDHRRCPNNPGGDIRRCKIVPGTLNENAVPWMEICSPR